MQLLRTVTYFNVTNKSSLHIIKSDTLNFSVNKIYVKLHM